MHRHLVALCHTSPRSTRLALCKIVLSGDNAPEWVQLFPAGVDITALDGRKFSNPNPQAVVQAFKSYPYDIPIDYQHANEIKAPLGEESPAAGWITELEVREGSIWGRVEWTPRGAESLRMREYRYISPAFMHDKEGTLTEIISAGLTNSPALHLAELAHQTDKENPQMDKELLKLLGLAETATKDEVLAAITAKHKAMADAEAVAAAVKGELATARAEVERARTPDLNQFVPREEYRTALARAESAEKQISEEKANAHKALVAGEIEAALKAGKITPATKDFYVAVCSQQGGIEKFRDFIKAAPTIAPESEIGEKPNLGDKSLTEEQKAIAHRCGLTEEQFKVSMAS